MFYTVDFDALNMKRGNFFFFGGVNLKYLGLNFGRNFLYDCDKLLTISEKQYFLNTCNIISFSNKTISPRELCMLNDRVLLHPMFLLSGGGKGRTLDVTPPPYSQDSSITGP